MSTLSDLALRKPTGEKDHRKGLEWCNSIFAALLLVDIQADHILKIK